MTYVKSRIKFNKFNTFNNVLVSEQKGLTIAAPGGVVETRSMVLAYVNQDNQ